MSNLKHFGKLISKVKALSKSALSVVFVLCLLVMMIPTVLLAAADVWNGTAVSASLSGSGTSSDPYLIGSAADLAYLSANVSTLCNKIKYFKLTTDIDLGGHQWTPIGGNTTKSAKFWGTFDGDGHTIKGLYYNDTEAGHASYGLLGESHGIGLFGRVNPGYSSSAIKNLHVEGTVISSRTLVGGIVGRANGGTLDMENCSFTGTVRSGASSDTANVGGLIGRSYGSLNMTNCHFTGEVTGRKFSELALNISTSGKTGIENPEYVGGLIGAAVDAADSDLVPKPVINITKCSANATVTGTDGVGGLVGMLYNGRANSEVTVTITNSYATGAITATNRAGGLVGQIRVTGADVGGANLNIADSYSLSDMSACSSAEAGGLFGSVYSGKYAAIDATKSNANINIALENCYFAGSHGTQTGLRPIMYDPTVTDSANGHRYKTLTVTNVYYKEGSYGTLNNTPTSTNPNVASSLQQAAAFTDGTVAGLLNNGRVVWGQSATHPVLATLPKMTALTVDGGSLEFRADEDTYTVFLPNTKTSLAVTPTVEEGVNVTINDEPATSGAAKMVALTADGTTVITVKIERDGIVIPYVINAICADIWDGTTTAPYPNAEESEAGTKANPYQIARPEHLAYMREQVNAGNGQTSYYVLIADIDLHEQPWAPIGTSSKAFGGTFDGKRHTIAGLKISTTESNQGLFGYTGSATIQDLNIENASITAASNVGGFIGRAEGTTKLTDCSFQGTIIVNTPDDGEDSYAGGLIGRVNGTIDITDCSVKSGTDINVYKLNGKSYGPLGAGGLIGASTSSGSVTIAIRGSSSAANIIGVASTTNSTAYGSGFGGIMGYIRNTSTGDSATKLIMDKCYATGTITAASRRGGLLGFMRNPGKVEVQIRDCYSLVSGTLDGGFIGSLYRQGTDNKLSQFTINIEDSYYAGDKAAEAILPFIDGSGDDHLNLNVDNVYYLDSSATQNTVTSAKNNSTINVSGNIGAKNAEAFAGTGSADTVLNLLDGNRAVWGQGATYPILLSYPKLQSIKLSKGTLVFAPRLYEYQTYVHSSINSITVTPTAGNSNITIKVGDEDVQSGTAVTILLTGETTDVRVKATLDGVTTVYTIHVTRMEGWDGITALPFPNITDANAGTKENPYLITSAENLYFLQLLAKDGVVDKNTTTKITTTSIVIDETTYAVTYPNSALGNLYGAYFKITQDINMNGKPFEFTDFRGFLDGGNHTIKGFTATSGLFAKLTYGSVSNLNVKGTVSGASNVGGIVGRLTGGSNLTNCSFTGTVTGTGSNVGGLVGSTFPYEGDQAIFNIKACWTSGTVTGGDGVGGLVGNSVVSSQYGGVLHLKDSYSTMTVATSAATIDKMAGLIGAGNVTYRNSFFAGDIASAYPIGFDASPTVGSVYYKDGSCGTTTSANAGFVGGTKKSAADLNSNAMVAVLNTYAAPGVVWAKGTDHPIFTYTEPADATVPVDPFYMTGLAVEHAAISFSPSTFSYTLSLPYSAKKIHMIPTASANLTITVDGQTVKSDELSQAFDLEVGVEKTVIVKVTSGDFYTSYTVTLLRREQPANGVWDGALERFDSGNGQGNDIDDPIIIDTPGKLAFLAAMTNGKDVLLDGKVYKAPEGYKGKLYQGVYFEITKDLILNDVTDYDNWATTAPINDFDPIGFHADYPTESNPSRSFGGIVNGNNHKIIGLYISGNNSTNIGGTGLFGSLDAGTVRNLHVVQSYVKGGQRVGGITGRPRGDTVLQNCSFSGVVYGTSTSVTGYTAAGGLIGDAAGDLILNSCWSEGTVTGGNRIGGLIGQLYGNLEMKNCYSAVEIVPLNNCDQAMAGFIGYLYGAAGTVDMYRSHFVGSVPTNTPIIGGKSIDTGKAVVESDTVYYRAGSYVGEVDSTYTYYTVEKSEEEFANGTMTDILNNLVEYGDFWNWETGENGYPVSDGSILVTDYREHKNDKFFDDGNWYDVFENRPGGTLKDPSGNNGGSDGDYDNSDTGERSIFSAVLILALISAISAVLLVRRKRSVN